MECDAFVLSSRYETFGVVLIEAMACGRPVIAPSGSGPDCIVTQDTGVLFPPDNLEQLSYQLLEMRNNFQKYDAYRIRQSCIDRFSEEVIVRRIVEVYERCTC